MQLCRPWGKSIKKSTTTLLKSRTCLGVCELNDSDMVVKMIMRVKPLTHWLTEREVMQKIKEEFDKKGIEIPYPHRGGYK